MLLFVEWVPILHLAWVLGLSDELLSCFLKRYFWSCVAETAGVKLAGTGWKKCNQDVSSSLFQDSLQSALWVDYCPKLFAL